jgi:hypothetical protein
MINSDLIYETECLSSFLCDDINDLYLNISDFIIPKNNNEWSMIEKFLYKELLIHIMQYKNKLILLNTFQGNKIVEDLSKKLYTKDFKITKNKTFNRFNIISYFFSLNDSIKINGILYNDVRGKLFLFPEEYKVDNIGIFGQLCYENIV